MFVKTFEEIQNSTPLLNIPSYKLKDRLNVIDCLTESDDALFEKDDFYRDQNGMRYRRRIENIEVLSSPFIVFNVQRVSCNEMYIDSEVYFPESISLNDKNLELYSIVMYNNMHYTSYIRVGDEWFYYDDIRNPQIVKVSNYNIEKIRRNCTLLFYS